jgi:hypothetical protein
MFNRIFVLVLVSLLPLSAVAAEKGGNESYDGLVPVGDPRVAAAWIDPDADFSVFKRVVVFEPKVAFRANWMRDQNRNTRMRRVSQRDMDRIKGDVAELFEEVFSESLEAGGYDVVTVVGDDVLVLRPSIIDLDVNVPNASATAPTQSISATAGSATLFVELFDSVSGDIIGRAVDRREIGQAQGAFTLRGGAANRQEARQMFTRWANKLVEFLDSHYGGK